MEFDIVFLFIYLFIYLFLFYLLIMTFLKGATKKIIEAFFTPANVLHI